MRIKKNDKELQPRPSAGLFYYSAQREMNVPLCPQKNPLSGGDAHRSRCAGVGYATLTFCPSASAIAQSTASLIIGLPSAYSLFR